MLIKNIHVACPGTTHGITIYMRLLVLHLDLLQSICIPSDLAFYCYFYMLWIETDFYVALHYTLLCRMKGVLDIPFQIYFFLYRRQDVYRTRLWETPWVSYMKRKLLAVRDHLGLTNVCFLFVFCFMSYWFYYYFI